MEDYTTPLLNRLSVVTIQRIIWTSYDLIFLFEFLKVNSILPLPVEDEYLAGDKKTGETS